MVLFPFLGHCNIFSRFYKKKQCSSVESVILVRDDVRTLKKRDSNRMLVSGRVEQG